MLEHVIPIRGSSVTRITGQVHNLPGQGIPRAMEKYSAFRVRTAQINVPTLARADLYAQDPGTGIQVHLTSYDYDNATDGCYFHL